MDLAILRLLQGMFAKVNEELHLWNAEFGQRQKDVWLRLPFAGS